MISDIQIASKKTVQIILFGLLFSHFPTKPHDSFWNLSQESKLHYIKFSKFSLISLLSYLMINIKVLSMQTVFFLLTVTL